MLQEFKDFIAKGNVMDLAVGIIIGCRIHGALSSWSATLSTLSSVWAWGRGFTSMYVDAVRR